MPCQNRADDDLRGLLAQIVELFLNPPSLDLVHILYTQPSDAAADLADQLNAGADPSTFGNDDLVYGRTMRFMDEPRLIAAFGRETARDWVSAQWMRSKSRELMGTELASMRPDNRIEISTPETDG